MTGTCKGLELRIVSPGSGNPLVVLDRGRGLVRGEVARSGVVAVELLGLGVLGVLGDGLLDGTMV